MYEEDLVFGPLTFKQGLCVLLGYGAGYYVITYLPGKTAYVLIPIIVVAAILLILRFKPNKISLDELEVYFDKKKAQMSPEKYNAMLQKKHAAVLSQIFLRENKGLVVNPEFNNLEQRLKAIIDKQQKVS